MKTNMRSPKKGKEYERSYKFPFLTWDKLVIPNRKQMESKMLDFPLPFSPVIALNSGSNPIISVLCAYDLKPSTTMDFIYIVDK